MEEINTKPAPLSWFTQSTSKYTRLVVELIILAVVLRLLGLVQPFVFQTIIDRVLPFQRETTLTLILVLLVGTTLFSAGLDAMSAYLANHMANRLTAELARRIYHHVLNLPLLYIQQWQVGETLSRIREIHTVRGFLTGTVGGVVVDVLFAIIYIAALLSISPFLTLIVLVILPLQIITFGVIGPFVRQRMQATFVAESHHQSRLVETLGNAVTMKALASEAIHAERFQQTLNVSLAKDFRVTRLHIVSDALSSILGNGSVILIIFFGSRLVFANQITLGELIAFHLLADNVSGPIMSLSKVWEKWQGLKIARLRLGDLLNIEAESEALKPALKIDRPPEFRVRDVSFQYHPDQPVLRDLYITIKPGRPTLIIGDSGCGKSTLAKILSGLYLPDSGSVTVNDQVLRECNPHSVRRAIAYVPQEPVLFSGSILDNFLMAKPDATQSEIDDVLRQSASDQFVAKLAGGIHSDVGERGSYLSGGQRQRIALARSLLTRPTTLIVDEPTSSLDEESAGIVVAALQRLSETTTLVVITHRAEMFGRNVSIIDLGKCDQPLPERIRESAQR